VAHSRVPDPCADWAYFVDIDGTLVDIAPKPSDVRMSRELESLLLRVHRETGGALALMSGRSIADIDAIVGDARIPVAGQHGMERRGVNGHVVRSVKRARQLDQVRAELDEVVSRHRGLFVEDKGVSIALHYRAAPQLASYAHRAMRFLAARAGERYATQTGKRVIEIKPKGRNKGDAVRAFMREAPFRGRVPVFLGDDVTDEDGFAVVNALGGHSIKVGRGPTCATWRLASVAAVKRWLTRMQPQGVAEAC
jgi:trehalose 6-phosphate phosphatase